MRYVLIVEYNGSAYAGFQIQNNASTIQGKLERALSIVLGIPIRISFAGRTDAGVHARGQVISFLHTKNINTASLASSLNGLLPPDIAVCAITRVQTDFHPRYSCVAREYEYLFWNRHLRSALWHNKALWLRQALCLKKLNKALNEIIGLHDFAAFTPLTNRHNNTRRHVYSAAFLEELDEQGHPNGLVRFRICANAFLHNMIRILLGSLVDMNSGRIGLSLREILVSRDRRAAGQTIAPRGLYLHKAYYTDGHEICNPTETPCLALWPHTMYRGE